MKDRVRLFIRDIETIAERSIWTGWVIPVLDRAWAAANAGAVPEAYEVALKAAYSLGSDPNYGGETDLAWVIRASLVELPPAELVEEARLLLEEAATRRRDPRGEPTPEWERLHWAARFAENLRRQAEGESIYDSVIWINKDLKDVVDALISLLVDEESRAKRDRIVALAGALRDCLK